MMEIAVIILAVAVVVAALIVAFFRPKTALPESARPDPRLDTLLAKQGEIGGRFAQTVAAQAALTRTLGERLEALEKRVGENLAERLTSDTPHSHGVRNRPDGPTRDPDS